MIKNKFFIKTIFNYSHFNRFNDIFYKNSLSKFSVDHNDVKTEKLEYNIYIKEAEKTMNYIYEEIDSKEFDIVDNLTFSDGVINIRFVNNKNYVLNIQRPNQQLWLSSPFSGPQRFEYSKEINGWINIRNKTNLIDILNKEINMLLQENRSLNKTLELI